jgi:ABC-type phosphate transport system auxiliary subunit
MKIKLKLSESQLNALVSTFSCLTVNSLNNRDVRVARSVLDKVVLKFQKKQLETQLSANLFNRKKQYSFSFEYYEAHYLERFLEIAQTFETEQYTLNVLLQLKLNINKQLA